MSQDFTAYTIEGDGGLVIPLTERTAILVLSIPILGFIAAMFAWLLHTVGGETFMWVALSVMFWAVPPIWAVRKLFQLRNAE